MSEAKEKLPRSAGRVAFFALIEEIRTDIEAGWALSVVYSRVQDRLPITYSQFRRYVRLHVTGDPPRRGATIRKVRPTSARPGAATPASPPGPTVKPEVSERPGPIRATVEMPKYTFERANPKDLI